MKAITKAVTITAKEYKSSSIYGNPSYWVYFTDEEGNELSGYTASNAACGYGVGNYINEKVNITFHYTRAGNLVIDFIRK